MADGSRTRRILYVIGFILGVVLIWVCGFVTGRITAPERPQKVVYVKSEQKVKKPKKERQIITSKRGKRYYVTPAGNRVYLKQKEEPGQE